MLKALRQECQIAAAVLSLPRPMALRRSLSEEALLSTDLPTFAAPEQVEAFVNTLTAMGWHCTPAKGWLDLDKPIPRPPSVPTGTASGELGCCISLLTVHPSDVCDSVALRKLAKAEEAGQREV